MNEPFFLKSEIKITNVKCGMKEMKRWLMDNKIRRVKEQVPSITFESKND